MQAAVKFQIVGMWLVVALAGVAAAGERPSSPLAGTPWSSGRFMLTRKHLLEYRPDGSVRTTRRTESEKLFLSPGCDTLCRVTSKEGSVGTVSFRPKGGRLHREPANPGYVGDVFFAKSGAYIFLKGYGTTEEYRALGVTFFDSKGAKVAAVRSNGGIAEASLSKDTTALLTCGPEDRKKQNRINVLSLYGLDGVRKWRVNTGALGQAGQSVIGSAFVYVTTGAPKSRILCYARKDGKLVYSKVINNAGAKPFYFYRYLVLSDDESTLVGTGWRDIVAIDAKTGETLWHSNLAELPQIKLLRAANGVKSYAVACTSDARRLVVLAATIGGINNSGPTVCRHYALFYDRKGRLQSVRDLKTTTDYHGVRRWHRLLVPVFGKGKGKGKKGLYVLDKVNEQILFVDTARNEVTRRSLH